MNTESCELGRDNTQTMAAIDPLVHREINALAYLLYVARGRRCGHELDDWVEAERIILERRRGGVSNQLNINDRGDLEIKGYPSPQRAPAWMVSSPTGANPQSIQRYFGGSANKRPSRRRRPLNRPVAERAASALPLAHVPDGSRVSPSHP